MDSVLSAAPRPFFSVVMPTKNRSRLAGYLLESVLSQSFTDFEVIVCDNDDTEETAQVIGACRDPRIRYHRTNGKLSMPDNWELGMSMARGHYVTLPTDRSVLKSYALEMIKKAIELHQEDIYVWGYEPVSDSGILGHKSLICSSSEYRVVSSRHLFDLFLSRSYFTYSDYLPKGMNSCFSSELLTEIRNSTVGRVCPPVNPDFGLAFLALAHRPSVVLMNESLYLFGSGQLSNGLSLVRGGATGQRFLQDLGITEEDLWKEVPIKTLGIHNCICNDLIRLKRLLPERFQDIDLDLSRYFITCHHEIEDIYPIDDSLFSLKMAAWADALAKQPVSLVESVNRRMKRKYVGSNRARRKVKSFVRGILEALNCWTAATAARRVWVRKRMRNLPQRSERFTNILESLAWVEECERASCRRD